MLRPQLHSIRRGNSTIFDFLQQIKSISDSLDGIGEPMPDLDLIMYALSGLGRDYSQFVIIMKNRETPLSFSELRSRLVTQKQWMKDQDDDATSFLTKDPTTSAFYVKHYKSYDFSGNKPASSAYFPKFSHGASSSFSPQFTQGSSSSGQGEKREFNPVVQQEFDYNSIPCQICNKLGHFATRCRYKYAVVEKPPSRQSPPRRSAGSVQKAFAGMKASSSSTNR
ncbi:uncharacterized protein LOC113315281 [Papaver somniferum]|uniref:uncharacterized protein LOC113315281 n=1 Tax=Papaver somniferum TaxID=3469 RepID=UPI000E6FFE3B|nr:uncharacterized protein LOC113315281 [Papaver somniferum]